MGLERNIIKNWFQYSLTFSLLFSLSPPLPLPSPSPSFPDKDYFYRLPFPSLFLNSPSVFNFLLPPYSPHFSLFSISIHLPSLLSLLISLLLPLPLFKFTFPVSSLSFYILSMNECTLSAVIINSFIFTFLHFSFFSDKNQYISYYCIG